ncbi:MAG TPA: neuraminidase-like domain-containing protein [Candidatus Limnocylindrales bacterium]|nr:neuraminidase-like domain-containing protein [Candidatus Limnocylindrales bacterium]
MQPSDHRDRGDEPTAVTIDLRAAPVVNLEESTGEPRQVSGVVYDQRGNLVVGLTLRVYHIGYGCEEVLLGQISTGDDGGYELSYEVAGMANLQIRALDDGGGETALSRTKFRAKAREVINVVAPPSVRRPAGEYQRMLAALEPHVGRGDLAQAREDEHCRDITLLSRVTRWDARLIALASAAARIGAVTKAPPVAIYGLLRVGLPADERQLAHLSAATLNIAFTKANESGVAEIGPEDAHQATTALAEFARAYRLANVAAPGTLSTVGELLSETGLPTQHQETFAELAARHSGAALWAAAREAGMSDKDIAGLQTQGKLASLTLNNGPLMQVLGKTVGESGKPLAQTVVQLDLHQPEAWRSYLTGVAEQKAVPLEQLIPPAYSGDERLDVYAEDLARKVRIALPTHVVARRLETGELPLGGGSAGSADSVVKLLYQAADDPELNFRFGTTPARTFFKNNPQLFDGMQPAEAKATQETVSLLQRTYQVSPTDQAMKALIEEGHTSAQIITAQPQDKFVETMATKVGGADIAALIYRKSVQVSAVVYNAFAAAHQLASSPVTYAMSPPDGVAQAAKDNIGQHLPTLEGLFGELDYCECEHCRSVLSPAAYLVDLLSFIDPDESVWQTTTSKWATQHGGATYPFGSMAEQNEWLQEHPGQQLPVPETPFSRLIKKRPDLPNLPLTCENTHTVLPYIDVVNEILEFSVAFPQGALPARDVGTAESDDLLAEPQFMVAEAYPILKDARYPLALPYDLPLDTTRRFLEQLDTPLPKLLEALCPASDLDSAPAPAGRPAYGWRDVFREQLSLGPAEYDLFTSATVHSQWQTLYGYQNLTTARTELRNAKTLARRLGVTYKELVELVKTWFVNPHLDSLALLRKLELDPTDVMRFFGVAGVTEFDDKEKAAFSTVLAQLSLTHGLPATWVQSWLVNAFTNGEFSHIIVLADTDPGCSFDQTTLRFLSEAQVTESSYDDTLIRINLLVRLRRRTGWKLGEVDAALRAFLPAASLPDALGTALLYLAHLKALTERIRVGKDSRISLLSLWSTMDPSRYVRLFLSPHMRPEDRQAFDHPLGQYLSDPNVKLVDHLAVVQGALNLTTEEIKLILGAGFDAAPLDLATISKLDGYRLLATGLRLPVAQLDVLLRLCSVDPAVDPFQAPTGSPVSTLDDDAGQTTLRFVDIAQAIKAAGFNPEELDELMSAPLEAPESPSLPTIAAEIDRIRAEHAAPQDPLDFTDAVIAQKLALVCPPPEAATIMGMWSATAPFYAEIPAAPAAALDPELFRDEPALTVTYDSVRHKQRLTYRGVLMAAETNRLKTKFAGQEPFLGLLDLIVPQALDYFNQHLLRPVGFLEASDFTLLFGPDPTPNPTEEQTQTWQRLRRLRLAQSFLPFLRTRLITKMIVATLAGALDADPALVDSLVTQPDLLKLEGEPLLAGFTQAAQRGLTVTFLDANGAAVDDVVTDDADSGTPPPAAASLRLECRFTVPADGSYRLVTTAAPGATRELRLGHLSDALAAEGNGDYVVPDLRAGVWYRLTLWVGGIGTTSVKLDVVGQNLPAGPFTRLPCRPESVVLRVGRADLLLRKVIQFASALALTEPELRHMLTHPADFAGLDLSTLPAEPEQASATLSPILRLMGYAQLRRDMRAQPQELIDVLRYARRLLPQGSDAGAVLTDVCARIAEITRRKPETVQSAAQQLGYAATTQPVTGGVQVTVPGFTSDLGLAALWRLLLMVKALGVTPEAVGAWANPAPLEPVAADLRTILKARFEPEAWRRVAKPVSDKLRQARRDALVAYLLHREDLDRMEELFERFLVDPGTEPVVQTSRLRLAISSVQTFIQRCLMNLEEWVQPSVISTTQWAWIKRYRVWEANRKIFLWPENWLEPEFRDDKTHLFQALEGELLQGDINADSAEDAFYHYLSGLDEIARLEIVSTWLQEHPTDPAHNILHVIGRTYNKANKYFYRTYSHQAWTPWQPISAQIESDHVAVTYWRNRPYLFWLTFVDKAKQPTGDIGTTGSAAPTKVVDVRLNWAEYLNGQWTAVEASDLNRPLSAEVPDDFDRRRAFMHATVLSDSEHEQVTIHLSLGGAKHEPAQAGNKTDDKKSSPVPMVTYQEYYYGGDESDVQLSNEYVDFAMSQSGIYQAFRLAGRNSPIEIVSGSAPTAPPFTWSKVRGTQYEGSGPLEVWYTSHIDVFQGETTETKISQHVLDKGGDFRLVTAPVPVSTTAANEIGSLMRPFFYQDGRHTFYVEPTVVEKTFHEWDNWILISPSVPVDPIELDPLWPKKVPIDPSGPITKEPIVSPLAVFELLMPAKSTDVVIGEANVLQFGQSFIGPAGALRIGATI